MELPVPGTAALFPCIDHRRGTAAFMDEGDGPADTAIRTEYRVFRSDFSNISTPADAEANGTPLGYLVQRNRFHYPTGLDNNKTYYFNVSSGQRTAGKRPTLPLLAVTLGTIYLYSVGPYEGNRTSSAARTDIDKLCETIPVTGPMNARAFISISLTDAIKDFPTLYAVPNIWPVRSETNTRIAWNWADILDDSINDTLAGAGVSNAAWWSGSSSDGSFDSGANCSGWTDNSGSTNGRTGDASIKTKEWIDNSNSACNTTQRILCVAW